MRKTISVLLLLCLVLMLFGCGQKTEENVAVSNQAAAKTEPEVKEEQKEETKEENAPENAQDQLIRPEIKEAIDSYEAFVDEYCAFMTEYTISDLTKLGTYNELLKKEVEMSKNFEALENENLTEEEAIYYADVSLQCSQKMLDVASTMLK